jgi:hypothetical protein
MECLFRLENSRARAAATICLDYVDGAKCGTAVYLQEPVLYAPLFFFLRENLILSGTLLFYLLWQ